MKVFRVENQEGAGPFRTSLLDADDELAYDVLVRTHLKPESHPTPPYVLCTEDYRCACDSLEALRFWFNASMLDILDKYGYMVKVFSIKMTESVSPGQVAFKIKNAVLFDTLPLSALR